MLYWVPAGPSLTLSPRRKPKRVINVLAASSTDGGGPSSWLDSPAVAERQVEVEVEGDWGGGDIAQERKKTERKNVCQWWVETEQQLVFTQRKHPLKGFMFATSVLGNTKHSKSTTLCINHSSNNRPRYRIHSTCAQGKDMKHPT